MMHKFPFFFLLAAVSLMASACDSGERALPGGLDDDSPGDAIEYEPCDEGDTRDCHLTLSQHNGILSCYVGTQTCEASGWGGCLDGDIVSRPMPDLEADKSLLTVTQTSVCVDNPCDPKCELFGDVPDAAAPDYETLTRTPKFEWQTGTLAGFPKGLVQKGFREPCSSGSDCQYNTRCVNPVSGGCSHDKCDVGMPLEPTCDSCVTDICEVRPECCAEEEPAACEHELCTVGAPLKPTCDPCVEKICADNPDCCDPRRGAWDPSCVQEVQDTCGLTCECCDGEAGSDGHCYFVENRDLTWSDARNSCTARGPGWDLASIGNPDENDFVYRLNSSNDTWIGLTEARPFSNRAGIWRWSNADPDLAWDESRGTGMYTKFNAGEPDGASDACVRMHDNDGGEWGDRACTTQYDSVCEGPPMCVGGRPPKDSGLCGHDPCLVGDPLSKTCDVCTESVCAAMPSCCSDAWTQDCVDLIETECEAQCECRDDEPEFNGRCYYAERNNRNWNDARRSCQARGAGWDLASVSSDEENGFLDVYNGIKHTWIGLRNTAGNDWEWVNGEPMGSYDSASDSGIYQNFKSGEPNGSGTCVKAEANTGWEWIDADCGNYEDSMCEGPKSQLSKRAPPEGAGGPAMWTQACVDLVASECDAKCDQDASLGAGACVPWYPGETDPDVPGIDLALDVPCGGIIPVCNHGQTEAPAGIRLVHFPANAQQYPKCQPDQTHPQMYECFTKEAIPPGECVIVDDCPQLIGNREIMVNPEPGEAGDFYVPEYSCRDNWSLYSGGDCSPPTCSGGTSVPITQQRPVDVIFVIDNSGTMDGEIKQVQERIYSDFAAMIEESGVDYRVIMMSRYGDTDTSVGYSTFPVCIPSPLGADDCSSAATTPLASNPPYFFHYSVDVGSWDTMCRILEGFDAPDELARDGRAWTPLAPLGYSQWLRQDALKVFVAITDDDVDCFHRGVLLRDNSNVGDGESTAATFDRMLLNLSPEQFGSEEQRNYVWHSIIGMQENTDPSAAWEPDAPVQTGTCSPGSEGPGTAYQALSKLTGGLRYPICRNDDFDDIFRNIATRIVDGSDLRCSFNLLNQGEFDIRLANVYYHPSGGNSTAVPLYRALNEDDCNDRRWLPDDIDNPTQIILCPEACEAIQSDPEATIGMEIGCKGGGYEPFTFSEVYHAECDLDERPQWSLFGYLITTPGDSTVSLRIRTAETEEDLASAQFVDVTVVSTENGNEDCRSPATEGCPIDIYELLGRLAAHYPYLEIEGVVRPTSDFQELPTVDEFGLSYSCPDAQ